MEPLSAATIIGGIVGGWIVNKCLDEVYAWARPKVVAYFLSRDLHQTSFF